MTGGGGDDDDDAADDDGGRRPAGHPEDPPTRWSEVKYSCRTSFEILTQGEKPN